MVWHLSGYLLSTNAGLVRKRRNTQITVRTGKQRASLNVRVWVFRCSGLPLPWWLLVPGDSSVSGLAAPQPAQSHSAALIETLSPPWGWILNQDVKSADSCWTWLLSLPARSSTGWVWWTELKYGSDSIIPRLLLAAGLSSTFTEPSSFSLLSMLAPKNWKQQFRRKTNSSPANSNRNILLLLWNVQIPL